ncbi:MAG: 3-oxoacyl-[acyl-carrier-protein] synthase, KASIII [uncultured Acidimicrobiales bacterium]|uniref:Beta-ketoacyl-[acyl-carrier-protein] synthase III n=1 Tax=uncultured Acidimicrobiales bacterium TaxID=310071 RepID=A0A6J4I0D3_9ACTN|nr:MAG: 3-oxoacyl-[acyl-carrier-protein] synthase, KASIII [uncultured Acidimicrobiales bacterium]
MSATSSIAVAGWGSYVPERVVTNAELELTLDTSDQWITERTGIRERHWVGPGESTATIAIEAGAGAVKDAGLTPSDIDLVIVATTTPDQLIPSTASFVADGLGMTCGSFDLNAACAGFAYSVVVGGSMIAAGGSKNVLVIGAETLSRFINPEDRGTAIIFADGAGAAVLRASEDKGSEAPGLLSWDLGCDGSLASLIEVRGGGSRSPFTADSLMAGDQFIRMQGNEVFRRAVRAVVDSATNVLNGAGLTAADVDLFVPHQANVRIVDAVNSRLGIPMEKTVVNIDRFGNTSAASIPLAIVDAIEAGRLHDGDLVLLSGFGAGMTWASVLMRWGSR